MEISRHGGIAETRKMLTLSPQERFDFSKPLDWLYWKHSFQGFRLATKVHKEEGDDCGNAHIYSMGREAEHVLMSFTLAKGGNKKFDVILTKPVRCWDGMW